MKNKLRTLIILFLAFSCLSFTAAAADTEEIPYPPRNFLYVVDCSGSMKQYQDALDVGRIMLQDLLPESTTTVIAFNASAFVTTDKLSFGGETSVLAGLETADRILEEQWQEIREGDKLRETTVLLFSDMQSTVKADDGKTHLTDDIFLMENVRLQDIEDHWSQRVQDGNLRFYSLHWSTEEDGAYTIEFNPSPRIAGNPQRFELDSAQEILKTCVEAYACVLTGSGEFQWTNSEAMRENAVLHVPVKESYRTFLYLPQTPGKVTDPAGNPITPSKWSSPTGGCVVMLENTKEGMYVLEGDSESCLCLTIPQPRITVKCSPNPAMRYESVAISVALSAGNSYLDYNTSNSLCLMEIQSPQNKVIPVASTYNQELNCYEFIYTPQEQGKHEAKISFFIPDEMTKLELTETLEIKPYEIILIGDARRNYEDLRQHLQTGLQEGDELSFALSDYFQTPYQRLEFVVSELEASGNICWEASSGEDGFITIQALHAGTALLQCDIMYFEDGASEPGHTQTIEFPIQVGEASPKPLPVWILLGVVVVAIACTSCVLILRKRRS